MKRFVLIVVIILLTTIFGFSLAEESNIEVYTCRIDSLPFTIYYPSNMTALYKGMSSEELESIELKRDDLNQWLDMFGLEFALFSGDANFEMDISKHEAALNFRLSEKSDDFIDGFMLTFIPSVEKELSTTISKHEVIRTDYNTYIRYEWKRVEDTTWENVISYYTVADGYSYDFDFSCGESVEENEKEMAAALIDCFEWDSNKVEENNNKSSAEKGDDEWTLYYLPQRKISIAIPARYEVITQDTVKSSLLDEETLKSTISDMVNMDVYLDALLLDHNADIVVNAKDNYLDSLEGISDETIEFLLNSFLSSYDTLGYTVLHKEIVEIDGTKYFKIEIDSGKDSYSLQYVTFVNHQHISFLLNTFTGRADEEEQQLLYEVVRRSNLKDPVSEENKASLSMETPNAVYYTDLESGYTFIIPNGWEQLPLDKERNFVKMKMGPVGNSDWAKIVFGQYDIYSMLSDEQKRTWNIKKREDVATVFDEEAIGGFFSDENVEFSVEQRNGIRYYVGNMTQEVLSIPVETKAAVFIENGYMCMFQLFDMLDQYQEVFDIVLDSFTSNY